MSAGSEHRVYVDLPAFVVYKRTLSGTFGDTYYLVHNRIHQRRSLPSDYLARLELWEDVFGRAPSALGLTPSGQIVTVQDSVPGGIPTQEEVDEYLASNGLQDVKRSCFVWKKTLLGRNIWIGDTRDENFVKTRDGLIPIDVRLWLED